MYARVRHAINTNTVVEPYWVEILSLFDRVTNFAHTGNPNVLMRGLMRSTWLSLGILETGYPSLWPGIERPVGSSLVVRSLLWPCDDEGRPRMSSLNAQEIVYGPRHAEVSFIRPLCSATYMPVPLIAILCISHAIHHLESDVLQSLRHRTMYAMSTIRVLPFACVMTLAVHIPHSSVHSWRSCY